MGFHLLKGCMFTAGALALATSAALLRISSAVQGVAMLIPSSVLVALVFILTTVVSAAVMFTMRNQWEHLRQFKANPAHRAR